MIEICAFLYIYSGPRGAQGKHMAKQDGAARWDNMVHGVSYGYMNKYTMYDQAHWARKAVRIRQAIGPQTC